MFKEIKNIARVGFFVIFGLSSPSYAESAPKTVMDLLQSVFKELHKGETGSPNVFVCLDEGKSVVGGVWASNIQLKVATSKNWLWAQNSQAEMPNPNANYDFGTIVFGQKNTNENELVPGEEVPYEKGDDKNLSFAAYPKSHLYQKNLGKVIELTCFTRYDAMND